jgi:hypothetical protein
MTSPHPKVSRFVLLIIVPFLLALERLRQLGQGRAAAAGARSPSAASGRAAVARRHDRNGDDRMLLSFVSETPQTDFILRDGGLAAPTRANVSSSRIGAPARPRLTDIGRQRSLAELMRGSASAASPE